VTTYVMAGMAREQVCTYMCPYARFQSIMFDQDSLIVAYDESRGEGVTGRTKLGKNLKTKQERNDQKTGDCIDCGFCVQVCPTGIDIRDGLQMSCVSCALCIDACDTVMDKLEWPRGLIRYASDNELKGKKTSLLKAKNIAYAIVLGIAIGGLVWSVMTKHLLSVAITQVRNPLYVVLSDGTLQNSYDIKLNNKTQFPMGIDLKIVGMNDAVLDMGKLTALNIEPLSSINLYVRVKSAVRPGVSAQIPFKFVVIGKAGEVRIKEVKNALFTMRDKDSQ